MQDLISDPGHKPDSRRRSRLTQLTARYTLDHHYRRGASYDASDVPGAHPILAPLAWIICFAGGAVVWVYLLSLLF